MNQKFTFEIPDPENPGAQKTVEVELPYGSRPQDQPAIQDFNDKVTGIELVVERP